MAAVPGKKEVGDPHSYVFDDQKQDNIDVDDVVGVNDVVLEFPDINNGIFDAPEKGDIYAIGDIHGDIEALLSCLIDVAKVMKIQNGKPVWIGKDSLVIFCGDYVDRFRGGSQYKGEGEISYEEEKILYIIRYLDKLARKDNGRIITVIGNHEVMNLEKDFTYVSKFCLSRNNLFRTKQLQEEDRLKRFRIGGIINDLLRNDGSIYAIAQIGDWIFCHGGMTQDTLIDVCKYLQPKKDIKECGNHDDIFRLLNNWATKCFDNSSPKRIPFAQMFKNRTDSKGSNVLWNRKWGLKTCSKLKDEEQCIELYKLLEKNKNPDNGELNLVIAHCPQPENALHDKAKSEVSIINNCCNGRLWRIDVAMSRGFDMPYTTNRNVYLWVIQQALSVPRSKWNKDFGENVIMYYKTRKPQVLKIPKNGEPEVLTGKKNLPRNDIKEEIKKNYIKGKQLIKMNDLFTLFMLDDENVYTPKVGSIQFPSETIFKKNDLKGLLKFMDTQINIPILTEQDDEKANSDIVQSGGRKKRKVSKIRKHKNIQKITRKHTGIVQFGGNKGRLKKGYKYSGKKLKSGLPQIIKCKAKKK